MDAELAALATSGATTIIGLMATDAWEHAKSLIRRVLNRERPLLAAQMVEELESSNLALRGSNSDELAQARNDYLAQWNGRFRMMLITDPQFSDVLRQTLDALGTIAPINESKSGKIEMRATASGNARVYQQGHGVQHNN